MKNKIFYIIIITIMQSSLLMACTAFCLKDSTQLILAKNFDWPINDGLIFLNKKGVPKVAFTQQPKKISWVSKYGSITFNQFGKEFPLGGMNEAGLVIEELNLFGKGHQDDSLYTVNEFQWVQYFLDNYSSVNEIVHNFPPLTVSPIFVNLHYLISDKQGNTAIIEFYDGKIHTYHGKEIQYPVLSNNTYRNSLKYINNFKGFGGDLPIRNETTSGERFVKAVVLIKNMHNRINESLVSTAFSILDSVKQKDTQWSIVYDIRNSKIFFYTSICKKIKIIDIKRFDFTCTSSCKYYDILSLDSDYIYAKFQEFDPKKNSELLMSVFEKYKTYELGDVKKEIFTELADYGNYIKYSN